MTRDHMTTASPAPVATSSPVGVPQVIAMGVGDNNPITSAKDAGRQSHATPAVSRTAEGLASLSDVEEEGRLWQVQHQSDVQNVQEHKLHHIHILNETTGERMPLTHSRRVDNPKLYKGDFPVPNG